MNWEQIYDIRFIESPGCWETCSSYCCSNFHADKMPLLSSKGVVLPLFPGEWDHQRSLGVEERPGFEHREDVYTLADGTQWHQHFLYCQCDGQCGPHEARPLICRIYPYFPIVDLNGSVLDFEYSSLMDLCYTDPERDHPCTLVREHAEETKRSLAEGMSFIKESPELIFSFQVIHLLTETFKKAMGMTMGESEDQRKFFKKFEWMVFSRKAWTKADFIEGVERIYTDVRNQHGSLELN